MKNSVFLIISKYILIVIILFFMSGNVYSQYQSVSQYVPPSPPPSKNAFWDRVQFGGGIGLSIGSGYTDISLAPSAIYNVNRYLAVGLGLQGSYVSSKDYYDSTIFGASLLTYINPIPQIQFSIELNESRVNTNYDYVGGKYSENFWNTALFLGAGYCTGNVTIGFTYNVLFNEDDNVYSNAIMPFVRVYF